jgi:hypothetical protein
MEEIAYGDELLRSLLAIIKSGGPYLFCRVHHFVCICFFFFLTRVV